MRNEHTPKDLSEGVWLTPPNGKVGKLGFRADAKENDKASDVEGEEKRGSRDWIRGMNRHGKKDTGLDQIA